MAGQPPRAPSAEVTRLVHAAGAGDRDAAGELLPLVYADLRELAAARMARLGSGQTLQPTALVHEAWIRLVGPVDPGWQGRAHFFGAAARAMRDVIADNLERKASLKRGGHLRRVDVDVAAEVACEGLGDDVLALTEALAELERDYPRKAEVVTLAFFGGLTFVEIAAVLSLSTRTVDRDWSFAKAWLNGRLAERKTG